MLITTAAWSGNYLSNKKKCMNTTTDVERLACFDKLYKTPSHLGGHTVKKPLTEEMPKLVRKIYKLEAERPKNLADIVLNIVEDGANKIVRLSKPGRGNDKYSPILLLSCVDNITRLQIGLKKPIKKSVFNVSIVSEQGFVSKHRWRSSEDGYLLSAARGLESVRIIDSLLGHTRINFDLDDVGLGQIFFNFDGFKEGIKVLSETCRWVGEE
jgi:type VI secretion system protein VasI